NAEPMRSAMHLEPRLRTDLLIEDLLANALAEDFRTATRHRAESSFFQFEQHLLVRLLEFLCEEVDLDRRERLHIDLWKALVDYPYHVRVELPWPRRMESGSNMDFMEIGTQLREHLVKRYLMRLGRSGLSCEFA